MQSRFFALINGTGISITGRGAMPQLGGGWDRRGSKSTLICNCQGTWTMSAVPTDMGRVPRPGTSSDV